jgi:hypothetical protein
MAVEFDLPDGFQTPQDVEPGATFDAVASLKMGEDGSVEMVALDGIPLPGMDKSDAQQPQPTAGKSPEPQSSDASGQGGYKSFLDAMQ